MKSNIWQSPGLEMISNVPLVTWAWKPKVPGSSPAATYVHRGELSAVIARLMYKYL